MTVTLYREYIREVLALMAPYGVTEKQLQDGVDDLVAGPINLSLYRDGVEWNLKRDYIRLRENKDTDQFEWRLTDLGKAKQQG